MIRNLLLFLFITCTIGASAESISVKDLRCEYLENPLGIDSKKPRLSWVLTSSERGQKQSAYRIVVASSREQLENNEGDLWDSGVVKSDRSIQVAYQGKELQSRMRCFWKVRVWDREGKPSAWSQPAFWSMGLLNPGDWKGEWIGLDRDDPVEEKETLEPDLSQSTWIWYPQGDPTQSAPPGTRYFRKAIDIPANATIKRAEFAMTGDNRFVMWINGTKVGGGDNFNVPFQFPIADELQNGKNIIAIEAENMGAEANPAGLIGCLRIQLADHTPLTVRTDASWLTAKNKAAGWAEAGFDAAKWKNAKEIGAYGCPPWGEVKSKEPSRRLSARYVRKEFAAPKPVKRANVYISGLGLYELRLNGQKIGDHVLAPGLTEYTKRVFYETYDVTAHVKKGGNAIGVILGNGRYYAPRLNVPTKTRTFGYPQLLLQMHIEYADGSRDVLVSDDAWSTTNQGPIRANNEYDGEEYDARKEMPGWDEPNFEASKAWEQVELVDAPQGALRAQMMEPIRVTETRKPIKITNPKPGMYIFDMGQNMVGWCRLNVKGPRGKQVKLRFAEVLNDEGLLYLENIRSAKVTDIYTLTGDGVEIYEPRFTYHGFRYVELTGYPGQPDLDTLTGCVVHDDIDFTGRFHCSNDLLNQIHHNIVWGVRGNYRSFPTDCPQRDERQAWLGDRAAEARGESYMFDIAALYAKWMADIDDSQKPSGSVPSVAPYYWPFYPNDVTWPSCYIIIPGTLYDQYGDTRVLEKRYPSMKRWIEFMSGFLEDNLMPRDTYGDWCVPPESPELIHSRDPNRKTAKTVLGTTYFYNDLRLMARYARILGKKEDARVFEALAQKIKTAFNAKFFDKEKNQYDNGSQTSYVLPLSFGMVPQGHRKAVFDNLAQKIMEESDGHIGTGLIGGQWLNRVLSDNGRPD
ncbi:Bacterial alpha-L-rhamnosidase, partial [bacterium]|nr:Bacterial alpha-L-rhamnosidase [bacterium]